MITLQTSKLHTLPVILFDNVHTQVPDNIWVCVDVESMNRQVELLRQHKHITNIRTANAPVMK